MKGILKKIQSGWIVNYDYTVNKNDWCTLPLHPESGIPQNTMCDILDNGSAEVEFEMVTKIWGVNDDVITYAKLIHHSVEFNKMIDHIGDVNKMVDKEISDEEIYKASHQNINYGGGAEGWIKSAFRQGAVWYREQLRLKHGGDK
jgi:hypothetical protein